MRVVTTEDLEELPNTSTDPAWDYLVTVQHSLATPAPDIADYRQALIEGDTSRSKASSGASEYVGVSAIARGSSTRCSRAHGRCTSASTRATSR